MGTDKTFSSSHLSAPQPPQPPQGSDRLVNTLLRVACDGRLWRATLHGRSRADGESGVVATRTADRPHGVGCCSTPQCAAERRPTGTDDRHQGRRRQGASSTSQPYGPKPLPLGMRSDRTARRSAGGAPFLAPPSLAAAASDALDDSALRLLTAAARRQRKEEEDEARRRAWRSLRRSLKCSCPLAPSASPPGRMRGSLLPCVSGPRCTGG